MIVLVNSGILKQVARCQDNPDIWGHLSTPRHMCPLERTSAPIGVDNDRFNPCYDEARFLRLLDRLGSYIPRIRFVTAPDVVADADATLREFETWGPRIRAMGFPVAFALQNGQTVDAVPWEGCDAVFLGGDTEFKMGEAAVHLLAEARARGKWRHVGRVNTKSRILKFRALGVDSIDGTGFSQFQEATVADYHRWTRQGQFDFGWSNHGSS